MSSPEPGRIILIKVIHQGPQRTAVAGNQHIALFFAHFADQFLQEIRRPAAYVPYGFPLGGRLVTKGIQKEVLERIRWNLVVILMAGQALPDTETDFLQSPVCDDGDVPVPRHQDRDTVLARVAGRRAGHADDFPVDLEVAASYVDRFEAPTPEEGPLLLVVDGEEFAVTRRQAGVYDYDWVNHRHGGYGFSSATSDRSEVAGSDHVEAVRDFLAAVDPETGFIEDDEEDDSD